MLRRWFTVRPRTSPPRKQSPLNFTQLEGRDVPSASPVDPSILGAGSSEGTAAMVSSPESGAVAQQPTPRVSQGMINFEKLPAAGTGYTLTITIHGVNAQYSATVTIENQEGANSPKDTRDAVKQALESAKWQVEAVGDTKLIIYNYSWTPPGGARQFTHLNKIDISGKDLKDNQLPTKSITRVAPGPGMSGTVGGRWTFGFAANQGAAALQDDVQMTIRLAGASGTSTVVVTLTAGMTPEMAAQEVATQLTAAGYASVVFGSTVQYDDPNGQLDSVEVEYTALGSSPVVDWLTTSVGFDPIDPTPTPEGD